MIGLTILGATGSIGKSTLAVIDLHRDTFRIVALTADKNWQTMAELISCYQPRYVVMGDADAADKLRRSGVGNDTKIYSGTQALTEAAGSEEADYVMAAIVGSAGLFPTLSAIRAGKRVLLANKESLVLAGEVLLSEAQQSGAQIVPVDSEHSAIFQCLQTGKQGVKKVELTASGGPFINTPLASLKTVTPDDACRHPNWQMGRKISVDSATMMNKGLEMIEAHYLFALTPEQIAIIVHPQSIVHSSVYYQDGSVISQLGLPDMRTAICYALFYPKRQSSGVEAVNLAEVGRLDFIKPDYDKFKCLSLVNQVLATGKNSVFGALNAANEEAVAAFLAAKIGFLAIADVIAASLDNHQPSTLVSMDEIIANDAQVRVQTQRIIKSNVNQWRQ